MLWQQIKLFKRIKEWNLILELRIEEGLASRQPFIMRFSIKATQY